jgi:hypothetical protein
MSDLHTNPIEPVQPVGGVAPARPIAREAPESGAASRRDIAAVTGGSLKSSYAQLVINPDTHDVVVRVLDSATHAVIREYPSSEVEHMAKYLKDYVDALERRRTARRGGQS